MAKVLEINSSSPTLLHFLHPRGAGSTIGKSSLFLNFSRLPERTPKRRSEGGKFSSLQTLDIARNAKRISFPRQPTTARADRPPLSRTRIPVHPDAPRRREDRLPGLLRQRHAGRHALRPRHPLGFARRQHRFARARPWPLGTRRGSAPCRRRRRGWGRSGRDRGRARTCRWRTCGSARSRRCR